MAGLRIRNQQVTRSSRSAGTRAPDRARPHLASRGRTDAGRAARRLAQRAGAGRPRPLKVNFGLMLIIGFISISRPNDAR
jgi:hypothetical protein